MDHLQNEMQDFLDTLTPPGFEPFFVPRAPLLVEEDVELEKLGVYKTTLPSFIVGGDCTFCAGLRFAELCAYLGCQIFDSSPGRGLATWQ